MGHLTFKGVIVPAGIAGCFPLWNINVVENRRSNKRDIHSEGTLDSRESVSLIRQWSFIA
jgi:hypothetical protein